MQQRADNFVGGNVQEIAHHGNFVSTDYRYDEDTPDGVMVLRSPKANEPPLHLTEIPQHFLLNPKPPVQLKDRPDICDGSSWPRFHVPVHRPLPRRTWSPRDDRRRDTHLKSFLAPLFTDRDAEERVTLSFLQPPENNPRQEVEERKKREELMCKFYKSTNVQEEVAVRMPNLQRKVSNAFVPQCAASYTQSRIAQVEESRKRQVEIAEAMSKRASKQMWGRPSVERRETAVA
ncbi:unnamed protein product [Trypanosoma congolense IL3000]|uniref:WGS project CAEQ00000000 data, annotated contig 1854 n=1 Tax=Trypanosoma congolense (strain IL3000) TaxID=1068625 RepID=F9W9E9_TRYCI|nr:unnamed protein product [Trypanosoma congolense IL3000]